MKNAFNVNDIVKARELTDELYRVTCKKNNFVGKVIGINKKDCEMVVQTLESNCPDYIGEVFYDLPNNSYYFEDADKESKPKKETTAKEVKSANKGIEIMLKEVGDGKTTVAILSKGEKVIKTAFAYCNPEDEYDAEIGCVVAFARLLGIDANKII